MVVNDIICSICCYLFFIAGPIVKDSPPIPAEGERRSGLESPKKRSLKLLPSFKISAFKKTKGNQDEHSMSCVF